MPLQFNQNRKKKDKDNDGHEGECWLIEQVMKVQFLQEERGLISCLFSAALLDRVENNSQNTYQLSWKCCSMVLVQSSICQ